MLGNKQVTLMAINILSRLHGHAEYGGKIIAEITEKDLSHDGDWKGSFQELKQSIMEHGIKKPLEIDKFESGELNLKNGHHRAVIAIQIGLKYVPVIIKEGR